MARGQCLPLLPSPTAAPRPHPAPPWEAIPYPGLRSHAAIRVRPQPAALGPHWVAALGSEGGVGRWSQGTRGEAASVHGGFRLQDAPGPFFTGKDLIICRLYLFFPFEAIRPRARPLHAGWFSHESTGAVFSC